MEVDLDFLLENIFAENEKLINLLNLKTLAQVG
jgi:hypothetical protein